MTRSFAVSLVYFAPYPARHPITVGVIRPIRWDPDG
jgi:hypothetical protein